MGCYNNSAGLGIVILNTDGLIVVSLSQVIPSPPTVIEVETLAVRRGP